MKKLRNKTLIFLALSFLGCMALVIRWSMQGNFGHYFSSLENFQEIKSTGTYAFLIWNLFLAWIPFFFALLFKRRVTKGKSILWSLVTLGVWFIFLPNAPYIITDFLHLRWRHPIPHWYDLMTIFIFAYTGLMLGLHSVRIIHESLQEVISSRLAWVFTLGSLILCGHGVYLGRVLRYNSWDLIHQPSEIFQSFFQGLLFPLHHPGASMAWMIGFFLCLIYLLNHHQFETANKLKLDPISID